MTFPYRLKTDRRETSILMIEIHDFSGDQGAGPLSFWGLNIDRVHNYQNDGYNF